MAKERKKAKDREPVRVEIEVVQEYEAPLNSLGGDFGVRSIVTPGFVRVRNEGSRAWIGGDYPPGKVSSIAPGEVAEVTEQRAAELILDYKTGDGGVGPFVIVGG